ncbi:MAG: histidinol-phosphate transaminase [Desulfurococcaceae archaeon TW002]
MLRLHMNESPYPPSRLSLEYINRYSNSLNLYHVEQLYEELLDELSNYVGIDKKFIEVFASSSSILTLMLTYAKIINSGLVLTHPTFHVMYNLLDNYGIQPTYVVLSGKDFVLDVSRLVEVSEGRVVYLINPNNPTSNLLLEDPEVLGKIARRAKAVFVDEAYYEFSGLTFRDLVMEHDNVIIIRTVSKAFSLAGARFGYVIMGEKIKKVLNGLRIGYEVPITTQAAVLGALRDPHYMREVVSKIIKTRENVKKVLTSSGLWVADSRTNFLFVDLGEPCRKYWGLLKQNGILTLCLENIEKLREFGNYLRVTVGKPEEMDLFVEKLLKILN